MSGGSMEYAYAMMAGGDHEKFLRYADAMVEELAKQSAYCEERGDILGAIATSAAIGKVRRAVALIHKFEATIAPAVKELSDVAHACEWARSGDYGDDCVRAQLVSWMERLLGVGKLR